MPSIGNLQLFKRYKGADHTPNITLEFKDQFTAHQIAKTYYGDLNQFQMKDSLLKIEERLDVLVYRTGRPRSLFEARSLIRHGKVTVNNTINKDKNSKVTVGSTITIQNLKNTKILPAAPHL